MEFLVSRQNFVHHNMGRRRAATSNVLLPPALFVFRVVDNMTKQLNLTLKLKPCSDLLLVVVVRAQAHNL